MVFTWFLTLDKSLRLWFYSWDCCREKKLLYLSNLLHIVVLLLEDEFIRSSFSESIFGHISKKCESLSALYFGIMNIEGDRFQEKFQVNEEIKYEIIESFV